MKESLNKSRSEIIVALDVDDLLRAKLLVDKLCTQRVVASVVQVSMYTNVKSNTVRLSSHTVVAGVTKCGRVTILSQ